MNIAICVTIYTLLCAVQDFSNQICNGSVLVSNDYKSTQILKYTCTFHHVLKTSFIYSSISMSLANVCCKLYCYCGCVTGTCTVLCRNVRLPLCITSMTWLSSVEAVAPLPSQAKSSQLITSSTLHHEAIGKRIRPIWHSIISTYHGKRHDLSYSSKFWMSGPQFKR